MNDFNLSTPAVISLCEKHRYWLTRRISQSFRWIKPVVFVMLNPSTADANNDDPTIRRCIDYTKLWGCTDLIVVNLFSFRATEPSELYKQSIGDLICKANNDAIRRASELAHTGFIVCAWGEHGKYLDRAEEVLSTLPVENTYCLKLNKSGQPAHPLYQKKDAELIKLSEIIK